MKKIGIIGAGWLGMDFVKQSTVDDNFQMRYTNRTKSTDENSFSFSFGEKLPKSFVENLDFLFITSTLPKENTALITEFLNELKKTISDDCQLVFTSTIGVYASESGLVDENSIEVKQDSVYFQFEQLLTKHFPNQSIILRLGGLIGEDRHPVFRLSGRKNIPDGQKMINLVQKNDILRFFNCILSQKVPTGIYNLVTPQHPTKQDYYTKQAIFKNIPIPEFKEGNELGKLVCSKKSQRIEGFEYVNILD